MVKIKVRCFKSGFDCFIFDHFVLFTFVVIQTLGTGQTPVWLYTPAAAFGGNYPTPAPSNWAPGTNAANVDLGGNALRESANLCFGIASVIGATILLMRAGNVLECINSQ